MRTKTKYLKPYQVQLVHIYIARRKHCKCTPPSAFLKLKEQIVICNELCARVGGGGRGWGGITESAGTKTVTDPLKIDSLPPLFFLNLKMNPIKLHYDTRTEIWRRKADNSRRSEVCTHRGGHCPVAEFPSTPLAPEQTPLPGSKWSSLGSCRPGWVSGHQGPIHLSYCFRPLHGTLVAPDEWIQLLEDPNFWE